MSKEFKVEALHENFMPIAWDKDKWLPSVIVIRCNDQPELPGINAILQVRFQFEKYIVQNVSFGGTDDGGIPLTSLRFPISKIVKRASKRIEKNQIAPTKSDQQQLKKLGVNPNNFYKIEAGSGDFFPKYHLDGIPNNLQEILDLHQTTPADVNPLDFIAEQKKITRGSAEALLSKARKFSATDVVRLKEEFPGIEGNPIEAMQKQIEKLTHGRKDK